jgi:oligogalacturonide transport system substrate-binding protein
MKKKMLVVGLFSTLVLAACGSQSNSGGSNSDSGSGDSQEEVTIKFAWWGADNRHDAMQDVVALFEEEYPHIKVNTEYGAWDGWQEKTLTQLSGKTEADVMQVNYNWLFSFGKGKNIFMDLNEVSDYLTLDNWDSSYLESMQVGGEQAAVPHGMTGRVALMNQALYQDNDLELPTTYDDLLAAGKVIAKDNTPTGENNQYAYLNVGEFSLDLFIAQMLYNYTGKIMQTDGTVNYSVDEVKDVLERYKALEDAGALPTFEQTSPIDTESNPQWVEGNAGSVYEWANSLAKWTNSYKGGDGADELVVGDFLQVDAATKPSIYVKPNFGYAISKNTKHAEAAATFIEFLFTNEQAVKASGDSLGISSNTVCYDLQVANQLVEGAVADGYAKLDDYDQTVLDPYFEDENVRGERYTVYEAFRTGKFNSEEAATQFIEKQQAALDKYYQE